MKYVKKYPVDAFYISEHTKKNDMPDWLLDAIETEVVKIIELGDWIGYVRTLEGLIYFKEGYVLIRGVEEEIHPCEPTIFKKMYKEELSDENKIERINYDISTLDDKGKISDGSHTFDEIYNIRTILWASVCNSNKKRSWKSMKHSDGSMYEGYFIAGLATIHGNMTFHQKMDYWDDFKIEEIPLAPGWDGHTDKDIKRIFDIKE